MPVLTLYELLRHQAEKQPEAAAILSRERLATTYGKLLFIGICSGAVVRFEMANQLNSIGKKVAFLGMVKPSRPRTNVVKSCIEFLSLVIRRSLKLRKSPFQEHR